MLCFVTTKDTSKLEKGSRPPMDPFESPFLGTDIESINDFVKTHCRGTELSHENFTVLDNKTIEDKTCVLASNSTGLQTVRSDLRSILYTLVPIEMGTIDMVAAQGEAAKTGGVRRTDPSEFEKKEDKRTDEEKKESARRFPRKQLKSLEVRDDQDHVQQEREQGGKQLRSDKEV